MKTGSFARRAAFTVALLAPALGAAACATAPEATQDAPGALLTVQTRGGLCPEGPCDRTIVVERDGRVHEAAKPPNDLAVVTPGALAALDSAIRQTDFAELRLRPFEGICPTAYDGQEVIFEFSAPGGVERISTCEFEVDPGSPLFVAVAEALGPFVGPQSP